MTRLPTGTVTFLFSDIEGSTLLMRRLGADESYAQVLSESQALLRAIWAAHGGVEVDTAGDGFFVAFPSAPQAVAAATAATRTLAAHPWPEGVDVRVRIGLHTGAPRLMGDHYVGMDVHRAARIAAAGHGGQVLLSDATEALARDHLPEGVSARDLGSHRLKDLRRAERIFQLIMPELPSEFSPLKTVHSRRSNLPAQLTALLGREAALEAVCVLLRRDDIRLVTLTGPGGIGKTRLSLQVAAELLGGFSDGVWLVRLSPVSNADLVLQAIADSLGLKEAQGRPVAETLREHLHEKRLLLVLDNFEQVASAAPEVGELLAQSAGLKVLVTSRVPLRLRGEHEFPLAPLPLPEPGQPLTPERLAQYAAVALFIERAGEARPDFAVTAANAPAIAEICVQLDGLPLAIELAAARIKLLPPEALLARLGSQLSVLTGGARDMEERQRTMRATIAWSEALLSPAERVLFQRLAAFAGGATLEAAEAVCPVPEGASRLQLDLLDGLGALVDESLVQQRLEGGEPRFGMLHVIREYALEQLQDSGEAGALRAAHAGYFLALAAEAEPALRGPQQAAWLERLEGEHDNLRAALNWFLERRDVVHGLRLAVALCGFWRSHGHPKEAQHWLEAMLALAPADTAAASGDGSQRVVWARAVVELGMLERAADEEDERRRAVTTLENGLAAAREAGDTRYAVWTMTALSALYRYQGDPARADATFEEALDIARRSGDDDTLLTVIGNFRPLFSMLARGEGERAAALAEEAVTLARKLGRLETEHRVSGLLFWKALLSGDLLRARQIATANTRMAQQAQLIAMIPPSVAAFACLATAEGQHERAARLIGAAMSLGAQLTGIPGDEERAAMLVPVQPSRAELGEELWNDLHAGGSALTLDEAIAEALGEPGAEQDSGGASV
jgi:predicted ATPase/class 3 adenylate cyclase